MGELNMNDAREEKIYRPWRGLALVVGIALMVMFVFSQLFQIGQVSAVQPELALGKMVAQPQAPAGSTLDYTIVITNSGTEFAPNVAMRDELPAYTAFVVGSFSSDRGGSLEVNAQVITWTGGLNANDQATLTFQAYLTDTAVSGTTITNTAIISDVNGLLVDTAVTEIVTLPDLSGAKGVSQAEASGGDTLTYTITISNSGDVAANNVRITDTLPAQLTYVSGSATASSGDVTAAANTIYWQGDVDTMGQVAVSFAAVLDSPLSVGSVITNTAHLDHEAMLWQLTAATTIIDSGTGFLYLPIIFRAVSSPVLTASPVNQADNSWTLSWSEAEPGVTDFELQESQTSDFVDVNTFTFDSSTTSYEVQNPPTADGRYYYRIRALAGTNASQWSNIVLVQGATTTLELSATRPNSANSWTVSWMTDGMPSSFELQEAKNPSFQGATTLNLPGGTLSRVFNPNPSYDNVYYYRIRALDAGGASSWSDTVQVIGGYRDDFTNSDSGWAVRRASYYDTENVSLVWYGDASEPNSLIILMDDRWDWMLVSPLRPAPTLPYVIEYRSRIHNPVNLASGGIVYGGDWNGEACPDLANVYETNHCFNNFYTHNYIWYGPVKLLFEQVNELIWCPDCGGALLKRIGPNQDIGDVHGNGAPSVQYHDYRVEVRSSGARLYINGSFVREFSDTTWINNNRPYFGVFASTDEYKPSIWFFEYYQVMPLDS
jgi:uncharacterized repeat protein (TIGR01451 family)